MRDISMKTKETQWLIIQANNKLTFRVWGAAS